MPGLLDIAPTGRTVTVHGTAVTITGVSAAGLAALIGRFAAIRTLLEGGTLDLSPDDLFRMGPEAVAAIVAAGTGAAGDPKAEAVAASLSLSEQAELLDAILEATLPDGLGNLLARLEAAARRVGVAALPGATSPPPSKPSSPKATARR